MKYKLMLLLILFLSQLAGCGSGEPLVVVITATPDTLSQPGAMGTPADVSEINRTGDENTPVPDGQSPEIAQEQPVAASEYIVQAGDTLSAIAAANNVSLETLMELNQITDPNVISVGQVIELPPAPDRVTPNIHLLADAQFVRGPGSGQFDVDTFVTAQPGYIRFATDTVKTNQANGFPIEEVLSAAQIVSRVSLEFSVDPRLLLSLLEYRAGWLTNTDLPVDLQGFPLISEENSGTTNRKGLYRQLSWAANELNRGYYGWKYSGWRILEFDQGERLLYAPVLNPATVGLQYMLHLNRSYAQWQGDIGNAGWTVVYRRYFGDPFIYNADPLSGIGGQPDLTLPFAAGETWFFTGGAHGGWGNGSAWSAIDFAPPDERTDNLLCYTSDYFGRAVAPGMIARSHQGVVVLDLDGDGDETTGWTILYLHIASEDRVAAGTRVNTGDAIGRPACEGGFSTATHMHIARRYNGEWLPADCLACAAPLAIPSFTLNGWSVFGFKNQEYQGYLQRDSDRRTAEQGRLNPDNRVSW